MQNRKMELSHVCAHISFSIKAVARPPTDTRVPHTALRSVLAQMEDWGRCVAREHKLSAHGLHYQASLRSIDLPMPPSDRLPTLPRQRSKHKQGSPAPYVFAASSARRCGISIGTCVPAVRPQERTPSARTRSACRQSFNPLTNTPHTPIQLDQAHIASHRCLGAVERGSIERGQRNKDEQAPDYARAFQRSDQEADPCVAG